MESGDGKGRKRYCLHYHEFAIIQNESLYEKMAREGWDFEQRGLFFSRFTYAQPADVVYHMEFNEIASPKRTEWEYYSWEISQKQYEEKINARKEAGWQHVCRSGHCDIYCSTQKEAQFQKDSFLENKMFFRLLRKSLLAYLYPILIIGFILFYVLYHSSTFMNGLRLFYIDLRHLFYLQPALILLLILSSITMIYSPTHQILCLLQNRKKRKMKSDEENDSKDSRKNQKTISIGTVYHKIYARIRILVFGMILVLFLLTLIERFRIREQELPVEVEGPYLLMKEIDLGEKRVSIFREEKSSLEITSSYFVQCWDTTEHVAMRNKPYSLYQEVYQFHSIDKMPEFVMSLVERMSLRSFPKNACEIEIEGISYAYQLEEGIEFILAKDNIVCHLTLSVPKEEEASRKTKLLEEAIRLLKSYKKNGMS